MNEQYESKVQKISEELANMEKEQCDKLEILKCRERELKAKQELFIWEKNNVLTQVNRRHYHNIPLFVV